MDPKRVIVNFQHISAFRALEHIVEQCEISAVLSSLGELTTSEDETPNALDSIIGIPTHSVPPTDLKLPKVPPYKFGFGTFDRYRYGRGQK